MLDHPQQPRQFRGDDREQMMTARQAAEALFTKPEVTKQPASTPSQALQPRKPRVLPILPPAPIRQGTVDAPVSPQRLPAPGIPVKKQARVRTLLKYGMSPSQVADLYRMPVATIERILQKA